jgi:hydroxymethylpyrimidine pyrophosphatase-like HAD family hydrolase
MINLMPPNITKGYALDKVLKSEKINPNSVVAIGDSLNDLSVFEVVKYSIAVSNSHDLVKEKASYTSDKTNGHCVSEIIDFILSNNKKY